MSSSPTPTIRLQEVRKTFGRDGFVAVDKVDLQIAEGEFVALTGPSGCGKSTLLRMMASLEMPSSGEVFINGRPPQQAALEHRIGVAFQEHALLPWLTARQNVELPYHLARRPVDNAQVGGLLELVGLGAFANARPKELSGGMRQRVAIARALVLNPDILLLDEPFAALDAVTRKYLNFELQRILSTRPVTTVLVTHSVDEAAFLADRVIVMSRRPGRIKLVLPVELVRPRSPKEQHDQAFLSITDALSAALDPVEPQKC